MSWTRSAWRSPGASLTNIRSLGTTSSSTDSVPCAGRRSERADAGPDCHFPEYGLLGFKSRKRPRPVMLAFLFSCSKEAPMGATEIKPGIFWVGAVDWAIRDFHGYVTPNGATYNNYLIMDRHVTLVDTVKHEFAHYTIDNIKGLTDPAKIENIVINHIENDHATSLGEIMELTPHAVIYITERGKKGLDRFFDTSKWKFKIVKTGDTLNTGAKT